MPEDALATARALLTDGDAAAALALLEPAGGVPDDPEVAVWAAEACLQVDDCRDGVPDRLDRLERAGPLPPRVAAHARLLRAQLAWADGRTADIDLDLPVPEALDRALALRWVHVMAVRIVHDRTAEAALSELWALGEQLDTPDSRALMRGLGVELVADAADLDAVLASGVGTPAFWADVGDRLGSAGRVDDAARAYEHAAALAAGADAGPDAVADLRVGQANWLVRAGRADEAEQLLAALDDQDLPDLLRAAKDVVGSLAAGVAGDVTRAARLARSAAPALEGTELAPTLAEALLTARLPDEALALLDRLAVGSADEAPELRLLRGFALRQLGSRDEARKLFIGLLDQEANPAVAEQARIPLADLFLAERQPRAAYELLAARAGPPTAGLEATRYQQLLAAAHLLAHGPDAASPDVGALSALLVLPADLSAARRHAAGWTTVAQVCLAVGEKEACLSALDRAVLADPGIADTVGWLQVRVPALVAAGRLDDTEALLDRLPPELQETPLVSAGRWQVAMSRGDLEAAASAARGLPDREPSPDAGAGEWVAAAVAALHRDVGAGLERLERAAELEPLLRSRPGFVLLEVTALLQLRRLPEAKRAMERLAELPDDWAVAFLQGIIAQEEGRLETAFRCLTEAWSAAQASGPSAPEPARWSAVIAAIVALRLDRIEEARQLLQGQLDALADRPADSLLRRVVTLYLALIAELEGRYDAVLTLTRTLAPLGVPASFGPMRGEGLRALELFMHGSALLHTDAPLPASEALRQAVTLDPASFEAHRTLAAALLCADHATDARRPAERALELAVSERQRVAALVTRARVLRAEGFPDDAAADCAAALTIDDTDPEALIELGGAELDRERPAAAVEVYERAWRLGVRRLEVVVGRATALLEDGTPAAAVDFLEEALPLVSMPTGGQVDRRRRKQLDRARYLLGVAYLERGEERNAQKALRDVDLPEARRLAKQLRRGPRPTGLADWFHYWFASAVPTPQRLLGVVLFAFVATGPVLFVLHATTAIVHLEPPWIAFGPSVVGGFALALPFIRGIEYRGLGIDLSAPEPGEQPAAPDVDAMTALLSVLVRQAALTSSAGRGVVDAEQSHQVGRVQLWTAPAPPV